MQRLVNSIVYLGNHFYNFSNVIRRRSNVFLTWQFNMSCFLCLAASSTLMRSHEELSCKARLVVQFDYNCITAFYMMLLICQRRRKGFSIL